MEELIGKTALITGSVQGIGLAIAQTFAAAGMRIAFHGLASREVASNVEKLLRECGSPEAKFFDADLRHVDHIDAMMDLVERWGPLDILVNNAGIQRTGGLADVQIDTWRSIIDVNLSAAFFTMRRALPEMAKRGYGRVINIASVHGIVGSINKAPYVASKFGLVGLSRVAALEYAAVGDHRSGGLTVNCICPGWTDTELITPQVRDRANDLGVDDETAIIDLLTEKQPSKRLSQPREVGELALWLCQPVAHNITGVSIPIDGGWVAQ